MGMLYQVGYFDGGAQARFQLWQAFHTKCEAQAFVHYHEQADEGLPQNVAIVYEDAVLFDGRFTQVIMIYAKSLQPDASYTYYKMQESHQLVMVETISFLMPVPRISFAEYNRSQPGESIKVETMLTSYARISEEEYRIAYRLATANKFDIHFLR